MCLFGFLKHLTGSINRKIDPILVELCVNCRFFVYLSNKINFTESKFMESEL